MAARRSNARKKAKRRRHAGARKAMAAKTAEVVQGQGRQSVR